MNEMKFKYKCRMCGKCFYESMRTGWTKKRYSVIMDIICGKTEIWYGSFSTHDCDENSIGVADFIGVEKC